MLTRFKLASAFTLAIVLTVSSCKKSDKDENDYSTELSTHSDDQMQVSTEMDDVADDANVAIESNPYFAGKMMDPNGIICDATIAVDTISNPRKITITYNGTNCIGNKIRTGVVVLSMPAGVQWKNAGAVLTLTYQNFKIKRISDNKSIIINGAHTITNVTGGRLIDLPTQGTIVHAIASNNMSITFDDNTQRTWQVARKRTFTYNNGIVLTITGMHTAGNNSNIVEWGINRFGNAFTTSITEPIVIRQDCNARVTKGQIKHEGLAAAATVTFGLDVNGNATTCPGNGNYYYKITWTGPAGNSLTVIKPY
jgi:hypothetical protein